MAKMPVGKRIRFSSSGEKKEAKAQKREKAGGKEGNLRDIFQAMIPVLHHIKGT